MKISKTTQVILYLKDGDLRSALSILKTFRYDFTREERRTIQIAYESLTGKAKFYESLGINTQLEIEKAQKLANTKYISH